MPAIHNSSLLKNKQHTSSSVETIVVDYVTKNRQSLLIVALIMIDIITGFHVLRFVTFDAFPRTLVGISELLACLFIALCIAIDFVRNWNIRYEYKEHKLWEPTWKPNFMTTIYRTCDYVGLTGLIEKEPIVDEARLSTSRSPHLRTDYDYICYDQIRPVYYDPYGENVFQGGEEFDVNFESQYQNSIKAGQQSIPDLLNDSAKLHLTTASRYFDQNKAERPFKAAILQSYDALEMDASRKSRGPRVAHSGSVSEKESSRTSLPNADYVYPNDPRVVRLPILVFFAKYGLNELAVVDVQQNIYDQFLKNIVRPLIQEIDNLNVELSKNFKMTIGRSSLEMLRNVVPKSGMTSLPYVLEYLTVNPDYIYVYGLLCELGRAPTDPIRLQQESNAGLKLSEGRKNREETIFRLFCVFMNNEKYRNGTNLLGKSRSVFTDEHVRTVSLDTQINSTPVTEKSQIIVLEGSNNIVKFRFQVYNKDYIVTHLTSSSIMAISMFLVYSAGCDGYTDIYDVLSCFRLQQHLSHRNFD